MNKKHNIESMLQQMIDYLKNKLSNKEQHELEREINTDPFLMDAMDGFSMLSGDELESDLMKLNNRLLEKDKPKASKLPAFLRIAAVIALFITIGSVTYYYIVPKLNPKKIVEHSSTDFKEENLEPMQLKKPEALTIKTEPDKTDITINKPITTSDKKSYTKNSNNSKKPAATNNTPLISDKKALDSKEEKYIEKVEIEAYEVPLIDRNNTQTCSAVISEEISNQPIETKTFDKKQKRREKKQQKRSDREKRNKQIKKQEQNLVADSEAELIDTIKGNVSCFTDGKILPGVIIQLKGSETNTLTDTKGNFELEIGETEQDSILIATLPGLDPIEININQEVFPLSIRFQNIRMAYHSDFEIHARPEGGMEKFKKYIISKKGKREGKPHPVVVEFTIDEKGRFVSFVIDDTDDIYANQLIRLLKEGPSWIPAEKDGEKVEEKITISVIF